MVGGNLFLYKLNKELIMIKRPALDDMPKDQEYTKEIDYGQKK